MRTNVNRTEELVQLHASLLSERSKLTSDGRDNLELLHAPQNVALDDQVSILHEQFVTLAHHQRDRTTLALIDAALERMHRGEFGACEACDKDIPLARLRAVPWALFCLSCQQKAERNSGGPWVESIVNYALD
jgi:DnaK suppressor protein